MSVSLARVIAAKPHCCDVERLVSAYNVIKDDDRCSLTAETIDAHLHIKLNIPIMSEFDVRPALRAWFQQDQQLKFCPKAMSQPHRRGSRVFSNLELER